MIGLAAFASIQNIMAPVYYRGFKIGWSEGNKFCTKALFDTSSCSYRTSSRASDATPLGLYIVGVGPSVEASIVDLKSKIDIAISQGVKPWTEKV